MDYTLLKELKTDIDKYHFEVSNCCTDYDNIQQFIQSMINKHTKIDTIIIQHLANVNKYEIDGNKLYTQAQLLKNEIYEFYQLQPASIEIFKKHIDWLLHYTNIYMKSDKLFVGMVSQKLDNNILDEMLFSMKQISSGNSTKTANDVRIGQILYDKYINIDESKLSKEDKKKLLKNKK